MSYEHLKVGDKVLVWRLYSFDLNEPIPGSVVKVSKTRITVEVVHARLRFSIRSGDQLGNRYMGYWLGTFDQREIDTFNANTQRRVKVKRVWDLCRNRITIDALSDLDLDTMYGIASKYASKES
jgi:hypothetical protein